MKEREISLWDLCFEMLLGWRKLVIAMVIGMLLLGSVSYARTYGIWKAQEARVDSAKLELQEAQEQDKDALIERIEEELTDTQRVNVNSVLTYEQLYKDKAAYAKQSILMQIDPNNVQRAEITFFVSSEDLEKTYNMVKLYEDLIRSGELFESIAGKVQVSTADMNEILTLEKESYALYEGSDTIRVKISHYDKSICEQIAQAVIDYVEEKSVEWKAGMGAHEILVVTQSQITVSDTNILNTQKNIWADMVSLESAIATYKSKFTEPEWLYYDYLVNGEITELSSSYLAFSDWGETEGTKESLEDIIDTGITVSPGVRKSYVILGAILAIFVYVFVVFVSYISNGKLRTGDGLADLYSIPQLGVIWQDKRAKRFLGFMDEWLISLRDRKKRKFSEAESVTLASVAVKIAAGKEKVDMVYLIGCDLKGRSLQVCGQIKEYLDKEGIQAEVLNNVLYDAQAMKHLEDAKGVVLVEKAGSTLYNEIADELELLHRQEICVLGGIVVE